MMELLVKNRRKKSKGNTFPDREILEGKIFFHREKVEGKIFPREGKSRIFPTFPRREKVGDLPRFSLGKKKVLP